jgi:hypothetical protein
LLGARQNVRAKASSEQQKASLPSHGQSE